jgi:acetyl-CoA synthetase
MQRPGRDAAPNISSYEQGRATFAIDVPDRFNPVIDIVERWASEDPDALALLSLDGQGGVIARQTISDIALASRKAARALLDAGITKGDRVFVMLPRHPVWYSAMLGCIRIGAIPMPGPNLLTSKDIAYRISQSEAVAAITDDDGALKLEEAGDLPSLRAVWNDFEAACEAAGDGPTPEDPTASSDPLLIYFTSGTVAHPKMVLHTQSSYGLGHVITARFWLDLRPGDLHWTVSDTGWAKAAWGGLFGQWHERASVVQVALGKPDADTILRILSEHEITSFCAPPTLYRLLVLADLKSHDLSKLRHCTSAGEPLNPEVIKIWAKGTGGLTVLDGYGQTETTNLVANYRAMDVRPGSMGKACPGYDVDVVDDDGNVLPVGEVGNIAVRTQPRPLGLFQEYYRDPGATEKVFRNGWYFTGDKAAKDEDGYLWFESRSDDVITSSAYRIGPFEVESALVEHPLVAETAVVGKDDPERTQLVCAFVILVPGAEGSDDLKRQLQDHVKSVTAPYKYPRLIYFVDELPKTVSGKIRRTELREQLRAGVYD